MRARPWGSRGAIAAASGVAAGTRERLPASGPAGGPPGPSAGERHGRRRRGGVRLGGRETVAAAALAVSLAAGIAFVFSAAAGSEFLVPSGHERFPGWLSGPLPDLGAAPPRWIPMALMLIIGLTWAAVLATGASLRRATLGTIVALHLLLFVAPPIFSTDLFGYLAFARVGTVHGLDPYTHAVQSIAGDPVTAFLSEVWPTELRAPYGPLFVMTTYVFAPFGVPASMWAVKSLIVAAGLGTVWFVSRAASAVGVDSVRAAAFIGLNPLWLTWAVAGAHIDVPMALATAAGVYLLLAARHRLAGAAFAVAVAVKATAGLVAAFALAGTRRRGPFVTGAVAAGAFVVALSFAVFGADLLAYPAALAEQGQHESRHNAPETIGSLFGHDEMEDPAKLGLNVAFAAVTAALLVAVIRGADWVTAAGWAAVAFLLTTLSLHLWYIAVLLPLAALSTSRALRLATVAMTALLPVIQLMPPT